MSSRFRPLLVFSVALVTWVVGAAGLINAILDIFGKPQALPWLVYAVLFIVGTFFVVTKIKERPAEREAKGIEMVGGSFTSNRTTIRNYDTGISTREADISVDDLTVTRDRPDKERD